MMFTILTIDFSGLTLIFVKLFLKTFLKKPSFPYIILKRVRFKHFIPNMENVLNYQRLKELKKEFIDSLLNKWFELKTETDSLEKYLNRDKHLGRLKIFNKKKRSLQIVTLLVRIYKLDLNVDQMTKDEYKLELYSLKAYQKSVVKKGLLALFAEEIGRWILQNHPTFYVGSLRVVNECDPEDTLQKHKDKIKKPL